LSMQRLQCTWSSLMKLCKIIQELSGKSHHFLFKLSCY
jgi:hypothetical protein